MYTGTAWTGEADANNESMTYDDNGNIKTLQRNQRLYGWDSNNLTPDYGPETIDDLTYTYKSTEGNQLDKVEDLA